MSQEIKRMSITEFREFGYLQELNRAFLHPHGLALEIVIEEDGTERLGGVWDYREDPDGMRFADLDDDDSRDKALRVHEHMIAKYEERVAALGYWKQPIPGFAAVLPRLSCLRCGQPAAVLSNFCDAHRPSESP